MMLLQSLVFTAFLAATSNGQEQEHPSSKTGRQGIRQLSQFKSHYLNDVEGPSDPFVKKYYVVTENKNTNFVGGSIVTQNKPLNTLGTTFLTSGDVYEFPSTIEVANNNQRGNGKVARNVPEPLPDFFLNGQCKTTAAGRAFTLEIKAHSCLYDLCLGDGGLSCVNLYSGTAFDFVIKDGGGTNIKTPPAFPLFILGGTGAFFKVEGTATIETIAGRTNFNTSPTSIAQSGTILQILEIKTNVPLPPSI
jgi:hypothetical protein